MSVVKVTGQVMGPARPGRCQESPKQPAGQAWAGPFLTGQLSNLLKSQHRYVKHFIGLCDLGLGLQCQFYEIVIYR